MAGTDKGGESEINPPGRKPESELWLVLMTNRLALEYVNHQPAPLPPPPDPIFDISSVLSSAARTSASTKKGAYHIGSVCASPSGLDICTYASQRGSGCDPYNYLLLPLFNQKVSLCRAHHLVNYSRGPAKNAARLDLGLIRFLEEVDAKLEVCINRACEIGSSCVGDAYVGVDTVRLLHLLPL